MNEMCSIFEKYNWEITLPEEILETYNSSGALFMSLICSCTGSTSFAHHVKSAEILVVSSVDKMQIGTS